MIYLYIYLLLGFVFVGYIKHIIDTNRNNVKDALRVQGIPEPTTGIYILLVFIWLPVWIFSIFGFKN